MAENNHNYYTNPAFCQRSEYPVNYNHHQRALSPIRRQPPIGAHHQKSVKSQEFYHHHQQQQQEFVPRPRPRRQIQNEVEEEVFVDDDYVPKPVPKPKQYVQVPIDNYNDVVEEQLAHKYRYEYIPMQEQPNGYPSSPRRYQQTNVNKKEQDEEVEDVEVFRGRYHRYAVIPGDEDDLNEIPDINNKKQYIEEQQLYNPDRKPIYCIQTSPTPISPPPPPPKGNPIATQKLHELLTTPRKLNRSNSFHHHQQQKRSPFQTPTKSNLSTSTSRSLQKIPDLKTRPQIPKKTQQKLNYTLSTRNNNNNNNNTKRNTAIIQPICSSPVQSVYSETTFSNRTSGSWMNLSASEKRPIQTTLALAALMMILCGSLTSGLCFYMVAVLGRVYYLDFGIISGFACFVLGFLGFRARNCDWLPNRNYISGYIVLSVFSLLTCVGLLVLLFLQPKPGTPLADVTSGAVCGISGLSLLLASVGVISSYCCRYPPPDNRVQHCAPGFSV